MSAHTAILSETDILEIGSTPKTVQIAETRKTSQLAQVAQGETLLSTEFQKNYTPIQRAV